MLNVVIFPLYIPAKCSDLDPVLLIMCTTLLIVSVHLFLWITTFMQMTHQSSSLSLHLIFIQNAVQKVSSWMTTNLWTLLKLSFVMCDSQQQLGRIHNSSVNVTHSPTSRSFIFNVYLTLSGHISAVSNSCCLLLSFSSAWLLHPFLTLLISQYQYRHSLQTSIL